ncbi:hypothetical protein SS50377_28420 [Spironucleus salmonicida]|uniref:Cyclin n=1 Tax=Spironucleus salmonicida TaxID=348837 RepID=V6LR12_9EUKA|nr:hypothetical protein SS50377_28420 [Spironucleus salmonicida]|eukprot:EST43194.1 Hypothetical protein SS50377_17135 [Spironucleus salmonicida]
MIIHAHELSEPIKHHQQAKRPIAPHELKVAMRIYNRLSISDDHILIKLGCLYIVRQLLNDDQETFTTFAQSAGVISSTRRLANVHLSILQEIDFDLLQFF